MNKRIKRINEIIEREISQLLKSELNLETTIVTVTLVDTAPNLSQAAVHITVFPTLKQEAILQLINRHIFQLQKELNRKLNLRHTPRLKFKIDQQGVEAQRIDEILGKLKKIEKQKNDDKMKSDD